MRVLLLILSQLWIVFAKIDTTPTARNDSEAVKKYTDSESKALGDGCGKYGFGVSLRAVEWAANTTYDDVDYSKAKSPWAVAIAKENSSKIFCTGTLISSRFVVTAAHCFAGYGILDHCPRGVRQDAQRNSRDAEEHKWQKEQSIFVNLGATCVKGECLKYANASKPVVRKVNAIHITKQFLVNNTIGGDIAILQLSEDAPDSIIPACLPKESDSFTNATIIAHWGWGLTDESNGPSDTLMFFSGRLDLCKATEIEDAICATALEDNQEMAQGDSGGGLELISDKRHYVVGALSCWDKVKRTTDVNTDLRKYAGWICELTGICYQSK